MSIKKFSVMSSIVSFCLVAVMILTNVPLAYAENSDVGSIVIYHTNDMHGKVNSVYNGDELTQIGLDVVKSVKDNTKNSLLIDAGDATQGVPLGKLSKGINIVKLMNSTGYDGMTLGNHEFDYGADAVMEIAKTANFPVVSANTYYDGKPFLDGVNGNNGCNFIKEVNGKKIGFFGITTEETNRTTIPENLYKITFEDEKETSKNQVAELKNMGADVIIAITHLGIDSSSKVTSRDIANEVPGIDIIIDGHSHSQETEMVGNTLIQQTGTNSVNLGKIEISFDGNNNPIINSELIDAKEIGETYTADKEVKALYQSFADEIAPQLEKVVGKTETNLYGGNYSGKNISRMVETSLGSLIADAMISDSKEILKTTEYKNLPIVAMENGGAVRSKIDAGFINMGDVLQVLPLDNRLSIQIISPNVLFKTMERGVCKQNNPSKAGEPIDGFFGGYPQISGMRIEYDITKTPYDTEHPENGDGERVQKIVLLNEDGSDKQELSRDDMNTNLVFACNDYTITEYPMVADIAVYEKGDYLSEVLANYITKLTFEGEGSFKYPFNQSRSVLLKQEGLFSDYAANVTIEESGSVLANKDISISIDGAEYSHYSTDSEGKIKIDGLKTGGHQIFANYNGKTLDACVDETVGIKSVNIDIDKSSKNAVKSTINVISQLKSVSSEDYDNMLKFATASYNSLSDEQKAEVTNYNELVSAQKSSENTLMNFLGKNVVYIIAVIVFLSVLAVLIVTILERKRKRKN